MQIIEERWGHVARLDAHHLHMSSDFAELATERSIKELTHAMELRYAEDMNLDAHSFRVTTEMIDPNTIELRVELWPDASLPIELVGGAFDGTMVTLSPHVNPSQSMSLDLRDANGSLVVYRRVGVSSSSGAWVYRPA